MKEINRDKIKELAQMLLFKQFLGGQTQVRDMFKTKGTEKFLVEELEKIGYSVK